MPHHGEQPAGVGGMDHIFRLLSNVNYLAPWSSFTASFTVGQVYLAPIEVFVPLTIDRLIYGISGAAGNIRIGLYERGVIGFPDLPDGGDLVAEAGPLAQPGAARYHFSTVPNTGVLQGVYFMALQGDNAGGQWRSSLVTWHHNVAGAVNPGRQFAQAFGPFTDPCPITVGQSALLYALMRVASVP